MDILGQLQKEKDAAKKSGTPRSSSDDILGTLQREKDAAQTASRTARADELDKLNVPSASRRAPEARRKPNTTVDTVDLTRGTTRSGSGRSFGAAQTQTRGVSGHGGGETKTTMPRQIGSALRDALTYKPAEEPIMPTRAPATSIRELRERAATADNPLARNVYGSAAGGAVKSGAAFVGAGGTALKGADITVRNFTDREIADKINELSDAKGQATRALRRGDVATARRYSAEAEKLQGELTAMQEAREAEALRGNETALARAANKLDATYERLNDKGDALVAEAQRGQDSIGKLLSEGVTTGTQMTLDAPANFIVPGGSLALMGVRSFGDASQQARRQGTSVGEQFAYGASVAGVEALTEKMFDGLAGIYGKGGADEIVDKVIDGLAKTSRGRAALKVLASAGGEASEEIVSGIIDPALESIYNGKDARANYGPDTVSDILHDAIIGGLLGAVGGAAEVASSKPLYLPTAEEILAEDTAAPARGSEEQTNETPAGHLTTEANRGAEAQISPQSVQMQNAASGGAAAQLPRMSMADFANTDSTVWNNVDYGDTDTQQRLMQTKHQEMVDAGEVVTVPETALNEVAQAYPDLRGMKKSERTPILRQKMGELKTTLRNMLNGLKGAYEFEVNGNVLEARLYDTGVREVMQNITQPKAAMLTQSGDIFRNAQYLYSTPDYEGNPNIYRWNYFYTPVRIGDQTVGVRIAVRDMKKTGDSQIYHWGIKENTPLGGEGGGESASRNDASSGVFPADALGGGRPGTSPNTTDASSAATVDEDSIAQPSNTVKPSETVQEALPLAAPDLDTARETEPRYLPTAEDLVGEVTLADGGRIDSLGSARSGFDPFSAAENKYGTMDGGMKAVRPDDVPISTNGKDHVSRSVVSMKGAAVTPDAFVPLIENETMKGGFSYIPVSNDATTARAESYIKRHGWDEALRNWTADVRAKRSGPDSTAIGALLYNNAVNSGDYRTALDILADFQDYATNTAQALQAIRILKTLTPENRLYMIERQLTKYNEQIAAQKQERNKQRSITDADNVPVEEWMTRVGEDLADQLVKQGNVNKARAKTVAETILSDLKRFYAEDGKPGAPAKTAQTRESRTEFDRIYDLFQNQEHYQEAWDAARAKLAKTLGEDSEAMAAYDEWFQRAPDYTKRLTRMLTGEETLSISKELADRYLTAQTEAERDAVIEEMQKEIAEQLPSTLLDKWNALRYLNMLGNFKTQIRNVAGNIGMQMMTRTKDAVAAGIENLAYAVSGGKFERTKAFLPGKALRDAAKADFADVEKLAMGESRYDLNEGKNAGSSDILREAMDQRTIFKRADGKQGPVYKVLEAYRNATNWAMEQGDVIFSRASYANALAGWLKAHNITAEQFTDPEWRKTNSELVDTARSYAIQEAQEATFRDTNTVSRFVSSAGRGKNTPTWAKVLGEGLMPFRKTPANVAVRAEEYSPLGLINTAVKAVQAARGTDGVTGADVVNQLSKTLTGSGLFGLGLWLAYNGLLRGGDDDDQDQEYFDDLNGHQNYALELPNGTSYTLDWVTPGAIPMFMGVAFADGLRDGGFQISDIEGALSQIAEPMLQMSMLSGINDTLDSLKYSKDNIGQLLGTLALSYATQGLTNTLLGQIERTSETERMSTYVEHDSAVPAWLQRQLGKASAKTPGWDYHQYPYINAWGQTESSGDLGTRALTNFLSPGYVSQIDEGEVETELQRLADAVGATNVFADNAPKYFSLNGETKYLTREEYVAYATEKGQLSRELISEFLGSAGYAQMDDAARAKAISELYSYANAKAKESVFGIGLNSSAAKIEAAVESGISPAQYFTFNAKLDALTPLDGSKGVSDMQRFRVIAGEDMGDDEKLAAIGSIMGTDMTTEGGGKSTYAKMLDTLDSGATLDQYLDLSEAGAVDSYLKYQSVQGDRDYGIEPETFAQFQTGKSQYDADGNNSYTQKEVAAAIEGIFGDTLTAEQKAVIWQLYNKSWKAKNNPYSSEIGGLIYDGLHAEPDEEPLYLAAP